MKESKLIGQIKINTYDDGNIEVVNFPSDVFVALKIMLTANDAVLNHFKGLEHEDVVHRDELLYRKFKKKW